MAYALHEYEETGNTKSVTMPAIKKYLSLVCIVKEIIRVYWPCGKILIDYHC